MTGEAFSANLSPLRRQTPRLTPYCDQWAGHAACLRTGSGLKFCTGEPTGDSVKSSGTTITSQGDWASRSWAVLPSKPAALAHHHQIGIGQGQSRHEVLGLFAYTGQ